MLARSNVVLEGYWNQPGETSKALDGGLDALLAAAAEVFMSDGVDAPVRRITAKAGVGIGTLYRHFPERSDLIVAVLRREVNACTAAASALAATHEPVEALRLWLERLAKFVATKRGLKTALHSSDPAYENLPVYFMEQFLSVIDKLMDRAAATGDIRPAISAYDLLRTMADIVVPEDTAYTKRMIALLVDGLRYQPGT